MTSRKRQKILLESDRDWPGHTDEFRERIDAIAKELGGSDFDLSRTWWRRRLLTAQLWRMAYWENKRREGWEQFKQARLERANTESSNNARP
jgi:hypothetical protein